MEHLDYFFLISVHVDRERFYLRIQHPLPSYYERWGDIMLSHIWTTNLRSEMRESQLDLTTHFASTILNSRVPLISSSTFGVHRPCGCTPYIAMETGKAMEKRMFPSLVQIVVRFVDCQTQRSPTLNTIDFFTVLHVIK